MGHEKPLSEKQKLLRFLKWSSLDFFVIVFAHILALSARLWTLPQIEASSLMFIVASALVFITVMQYHRVYRIYWPRASGFNVQILFFSTLWTSAILTVADLLITRRPLPITVLWIGMILSFGGIVLLRYRSRIIGALNWRWRAIWRQEFPISEVERVLIVGAGESGHNTAVRLKRGFRDAKYYIVGFVDDDPRKQDMFIEGAQVLGFTEDIPEIVKREKIDMIVVALHNISGAKLNSILQACENSAARVKLVPNILQFFDNKLNSSFLRDVQPEDLIGRSLVTHHKAVDLHAVTNRVVLVTGAAGSIGSELARQMLDYHQPSKLIILDNNESGLFDLQQELLIKHKNANVETVLADITHAQPIMDVLADYRPHIVFHAAAYKHVPMLQEYPNEAIRVNIGGTLNLANAAIKHKVERFVLISTDKAVDPSSVMGASKRICELLIHALSEEKSHKTRFTAVRFGNVLGSRGSVVPLFLQQINNGGPVTVTDKRMTRYFMSISEAVNLVIHAAALTEGNDIFVLKMGEVVKIDELAKRMIRLLGLRPHVDIKIEYTGVRAGEKLHETLNDEFEYLRETSHPSIMKLSEWNINGRSGDLMAMIYELVQTGISDDNQALAVLRDICGLNQELAKTGD
jgi:FlaA1/EpsC-like NDP-sugar epimerase